MTKSDIIFEEPHFQWPNLREEEIGAVNTYLRNGRDISLYGREGIYIELEDKIAKYHNIDYVLTTNSGTSALHSAYFGIGLKPGDEVLAPTNTFLATVMPMLHCGATPILCDAELDTGNIDPLSVRQNITAKSKAIVVTHLWGHPVELDEICEIAEENDLCLIEDCSHAHGATYKGKKVGTFGDVSAFSLQGKKMITAGEGGFLMTNNQEIYERATLLGHFRVRSEQCVSSPFYKQFVKTGLGLNYRMHPLGAVIANVQFDHLDEWNGMRNERLSYFSIGLSKIPGIEPPPTRNYVSRGAFYGFKVKCEEEILGIDILELVSRLQTLGIDVHRPGSRPLHLLPFFQTKDDGMFGFPKHIYTEGDLPQSEEYYKCRISLPTFTFESFELIDHYISAFRTAAEGNSKEA